MPKGKTRNSKIPQVSIGELGVEFNLGTKSITPLLIFGYAFRAAGNALIGYAEAETKGFFIPGNPGSPSGTAIPGKEVKGKQPFEMPGFSRTPHMKGPHRRFPVAKRTATKKRNRPGVK